VKIHDLSGLLGISLGVLDQLYGKHRIHHQRSTWLSHRLSQTEAHMSQFGIHKNKRELKYAASHKDISDKRASAGGEQCMKTSEYKAAVAVTGLSAAGVQKLFGVDQTTTRRWASGETEVPRAVGLCLLLMASANVSVAQAEILADDTDVRLARIA
jgi:hypothetical protein